MAPSQVTVYHDVPGTIHLLHETGDPTVAGSQLVLQPRPSSDPEDPLNWTRRRKLLAISMVYFYVFSIGIAACVQYSVLTQISNDTGIRVSELNLGTGLMFLFLGWGCLIWQPIALAYGRRGVYIASVVLSIVPMVWATYSSGVGQWYAHRSLLGLLAAPVESLPEVSVPDLFFAHERGNYMGVYAFVLFGSNYLAPFFAGFINDSADWRWTMHFGSLVLAACAVLMFFFMEETMYFRNDIESERVEEQKPTATVHEVHGGTPSPSPERPLPPMSYTSKLKLLRFCDRRPTPKQALRKSWRAIAIFAFFPNVVWAGLLYGTNLAWYNVLNATISPLLGAPPYNFSPKMIGVAYLSPFFFGAIGAVWSGRISDLTMMRLVRRNSGIREPEQRLWALSISGLLCSAGLVLWGVGGSKGIHFMGLIFGFGFVALGIVCAGSIALAYAVDCFKEIAGESMITIIIIRNTIGFAFNYAIDPWINAIGLQNCFVSAAFISLLCTGSFLLMMIFGKKSRRLSARKYWQYVTEDLDVQSE
ncbi:hypothetical protein DL769_011408 [Monosporascus sp. CRB-8-3]|nr:hypothetical protein DL769_011408 [Monosporascus sp. CRB-8-3]